MNQIVVSSIPAECLVPMEEVVSIETQNDEQGTSILYSDAGNWTDSKLVSNHIELYRRASPHRVNENLHDFKKQKRILRTTWSVARHDQSFH